MNHETLIYRMLSDVEYVAQANLSYCGNENIILTCV